MMLRIVVSTLTLHLIASAAASQTFQTGFLDRSIAHGDRTHSYQVYVPRDYHPSRPWPAILFLHGSGERGDDGLKQTQVGLGSQIRWNPDRWPAIVVFPQAAEGETWQGPSGEIALAALDAAIEEFHVDETRVYLTGLSLGGRGAWALAFTQPERFAALVPVCGFVNGLGRYPPFLPADVEDPFAHLAQRIAHLPTWIFHGDEDPVVPVGESRRMAAALKAIGADVRYDELEGIGHDAWEHAYSDPRLAEWLFQQRRR